jgi:hypothetical protein
VKELLLTQPEIDDADEESGDDLGARAIAIMNKRNASYGISPLPIPNTKKSVIVNVPKRVITTATMEIVTTACVKTACDDDELVRRVILESQQNECARLKREVEMQEAYTRELRIVMEKSQVDELKRIHDIIDAERAENHLAKTELKALQDELNERRVAINAQEDAMKAQGEDNDDGLCNVCLDRPACLAFIPCGHVCACVECYVGCDSGRMQLENGNKLCPLCRAIIQNTQRVFLDAKRHIKLN